MYSMIKWIGPGAVVGGLGAAMFCGAGLASADTGNEARSADRGANASATASASETPARKARSGPARGARVAAPEAPASRIGAVPASESALESAPESVSVPESAPESVSVPELAPETAPVSVSTPVSASVPVAQARTQRGRVQPVAALQVNDEPPASPVRVAAAPAAAAVPAAPFAAAAAPASPPPAAAIAATAPTAAATAAPVPVVPSSVPVDPAQFAGTYYEQGSVKQFFSLGLVNTKAVYTVRPDGTLGVRNSGNYFFNRGPRSKIVGSAVPVNADNTALNVGFSPFSPPSANPPGNYTILYHAPDYSYVIVSDPSGQSGYILTRSKTISPQEYQQLLDQARALGVQGRITPTKQYA